MALYVDIEKRIGDFHLVAQFEVGHEVLGVLGASGCGKSMTLRCIAGVETPDKGVIICDGEVLFDHKKKINIPIRERKVGYLFQNYALFPNMTVRDNIKTGLDKKVMNKSDKLEQYITKFRLEGLEKHYPQQLSGGQKQRVALARMLITEPKLILLDEPFSALDITLKNELEEELRQMTKTFNGTTLFVSHNQEEIESICHQIVTISNGKMGYVREKEKLFSHPQTLEEAKLAGWINFSPITRRANGLIEVERWGINLTLDQWRHNIRYVGIRPHHIDIAQAWEQKDVIWCTGVSWIEKPFHYRVTTREPRLTLDVSKEKWENCREKEPLKIKIPREHLALLE